MALHVHYIKSSTLTQNTCNTMHPTYSRYDGLVCVEQLMIATDV
jgi:hypothetical protein